MRQFGTALMFAGVLTVIAAFNAETTVSSSGSFIGGTFVGGSTTYNLGLLQHQMMLLHTGLASFVAGAFLFGAGGSVQPSSSEPPTGHRSTNRWADLQEDETEEERDERVRQGHRRDLWIAGVILAVIIAAALWFDYSIKATEDPDDSVTMDMNTEMMDLNAEADMALNEMPPQ